MEFTTHSSNKVRGVWTMESNISKDQSTEAKLLQKRRSFLLEYLRDFTSNTGLHGLRYIGEPSRFLVERIFWLVMFIISVTICGLLIKNLWTKWSESPVIVSFGESLVSIWEVPFPAVTICTNNKISYHRYKYDLDTYNKYVESNMTESEKQRFQDLSILCSVHNHIEYNTSQLYGNSSIVDNLRAVAPKLKALIHQCEWREEHQTNCRDLFSEVLTNKGVCYTFNGLSTEDLYRTENIQKVYKYTNETLKMNGWSLERGYSPEVPSDSVYPRRGRDFGLKADLRLSMYQFNHDLNPLCEGPLRGYEVLIHNPAEKPRLFRYQFEVAAGVEMNVAITMNIVTSTDSLRSYNAESRQCYFPTERYLRYFKMYTQTNCEEECRANYTFAMCDCVAFYMPYESTRICTLRSHECVMKAKEDLATHRMIVNLHRTKGSPIITENDQERKLIEVVKRCHCMPTCTTISYDSDRNSVERNLDRWVSSIKHETTLEDGLYTSTRLNFFFKETQFTSVRRSELYGQTDFLANCGGLLGLFLGFSVLSLVEIVYFVTLRLFSVIISNRKSTVASTQPTIQNKY